MPIGRRAAPILAALLLAACSGAPGPTHTPSATHLPSSPDPTATPAPTSTPTAKPTVGPVNNTAGGVYAATTTATLAPSLAGVPERVYVPDERSGDVAVIDPRTFRVLGHIRVGASPEHVTPDWDLRQLYVNDMLSNRLTVIDPKTGTVTRTIAVPTPYNLYFTVDGSKAIVVEDSTSASGYGNGLRFYDRATWKFLRNVPIPFPGADHLDFTADGRYLFVSCEYSGEVVRVDARNMTVAGSIYVGGLPVDVRLAPAGDAFFVANQGTDGVSIVDPRAMRVMGFIPTGNGAHGLALSRDAKRLFVTNRRAGTISVINIASRRVIATWRVGGSPDMMAISADGSQLWVSNRYAGFVTVIDTQTGSVLRRIQTGAGPHGLSFWPQPGRFSLGHNGNMR